MDDKIKVIIGFVLIILAVVFYLFAQTLQSMETVGTMLFSFLLAGIFGIVGILMIGRYLPRIL